MNKIKNKLLISYILYIFIGMGVLGLIIYVFFSNMVRNNLDDISQSLIKNQINSIDNEIREYQNYIDFFSNSYEINEYVIGNINDFSGDLIISQNNLEEYINKYFCFDNSINMILFNLEDSKSDFVYGDKTLDYSELRNSIWFSDCKEYAYEIQQRMVTIRDIEGVSDNYYCIGKSFVISGENNDEYSVIIGLVFKSNQLMKCTEKTSDYLLIDNKGQIIDGNLPGLNLNNISFIRNSEILNTVSGNGEYIYNDEKFKLFYEGSQNGNLKLIYIDKYNAYFSQNKYLIMVILLAIVICISLFTFMTHFISKLIIKPILKLKSAIIDVKNGVLRMCPITNEEDEIGEITVGFNNLVKSLENTMQNLVREEKQKTDLYYQSLFYQINPHFLYNTLAAIRHIALGNKDKQAADMIVVLSRLLRNTLVFSNHPIPLSNEISNVKDFIKIMEMRYENGIDVTFDIHNSVINVCVIGMILQPIVENSINHGLFKKINYGEHAIIKIHAYEKDNKLVISVYDNGCGIEECKIEEIFKTESLRKSKNIGVKNVHDRIKAFCGDDYGLSIESEVESFTRVNIFLPLDMIMEDDEDD